jgi:hypothetical protein
MSKQTLRALAKDYATGVIDKDNYRKSRVELIKGIVAGEIAVKAIDYAPPLMPSEEEAAITETAKRERTKATPEVTPKSKPVATNNVKNNNKKTPIVFISVSTVIVLSLIIAVFLFYPKPPGSASIETTNVTKNTTKTNATATSTSMAGESLIAGFLTEKNWNENSLDKFIESWSALTQEERDSAKQTKRMQRMNDSIYKQFLEEKALASIDSEKAIIKQQKLIELAEAIGINDSRLILNWE